MDEQENTPWQYKPDDGAPAPDLPDDDSDAPDQKRPPKSKPISWQAAEFIEHPHPASWYAALVAVTLVVAGLVYLVARDYFATAVIVVLGGIVAAFSRHKPSQAQYEISSSGLRVNDKLYLFSSFKSFSILSEGNLKSINLIPLKRFMPPIAAYFDPADEEKIVGAIGNYLPFEERQLASIDRLSRRLRL